MLKFGGFVIKADEVSNMGFDCVIVLKLLFIVFNEFKEGSFGKSLFCLKPDSSSKTYSCCSSGLIGWIGLFTFGVSCVLNYLFPLTLVLIIFGLKTDSL